MRRSVVLMAAAVLLAVGCEQTLEEPIPDEPDWVHDVEPILRGNCFHCHGANWRKLGNPKRWDLYDPAKIFAAVGVMSPPAEFINPVVKPTGSERRKIDEILDRVLGTTGALMPPPPARPLSSREIEILQRWRDAAPVPPRGMRGADNNPPNAEWLVPGLSFVVSDGDHEQVVGVLRCPPSTTEIQLHRSGTFASDDLGDTIPKAGCKVTLSDGEATPPEITLP